MADEPAKTSTDVAQDSGCQVDWSWLVGREIVGATSDLDSLVLTLSDGQTLKVKAALWQGKAFLAGSRADELIALVFERAPHRIADARFIVDYENPRLHQR